MIKLKTFFVTVSVVMLSVNAPAQSLHVLGFDSYDGRPTMEITINGKGPYNFILDTGASGSVIDSNLLEELNIEKGRPIRVGSPGSQQAREGYMVSIESASISDFNLPNIRTVALDFSEVFPKFIEDNISGVLSYRTFSEYLIIFDFRQNRLILGQESLDSDEGNVLPISNPRIIAFDAFLEGEKVEGHIDTGSPAFITVPYSWKDRLSLSSEPVKTDKARLAGGEVDIYEANLDGTVEIGKIKLNDPKISLITAKIGAVNFGVKFLKDYLISIDLKKNLIRFDPVGS